MDVDGCADKVVVLVSSLPQRLHGTPRSQLEGGKEGGKEGGRERGRKGGREGGGRDVH